MTTFGGVYTVSELLLGLILLPVLKVQPELMGSPRPVVGLVGHYCVLPCSLQPAETVVGKTVEWTRPDLTPSYVHILRQGSLLHSEINPSFLQRANLFEQELRHGNMSLKLSDLKVSDAGTYTCKLITTSVTSTQVSLIIGSVSEPQIFPERFEDKLLFRCEAKNWYPEPEMEWRDSEGRIIPHDHVYTKTQDEYFSVYSKIKVDIAASENYTCTVRQMDIGEVRVANYTAPQVYGEVASLKILTLHLRGWLVVTLLLVFSALILGIVMLIWAGRNLVRKTDAVQQNTPQEENDETDGAGIPMVQYPVNENINLQEQLQVLQQQIANLTTEKSRLEEEVESLKREIQDLKEVVTDGAVTSETEAETTNCSSDG